MVLKKVLSKDSDPEKKKSGEQIIKQKRGFLVLQRTDAPDFSRKGIRQAEPMDALPVRFFTLAANVSVPQGVCFAIPKGMLRDTRGYASR